MASDPTDYYKLKWKVLIGGKKSAKPLLFRIGFFGVINTAITTYFYNYIQDTPILGSDFLGFVVVFQLVITAVLWYFWGRLTHTEVVNMRSYELSSDGLVRNGRVRKLSLVNVADFQKKVQKVEKNGFDLKKGTPSFKLKFKSGPLRIYFNSEAEGEKFIKSMKKYLSL